MKSRRFIKAQISGIVRQIAKPKTGKPEEVPELLAELEIWFGLLRRMS
jgi:hypothetical protein